jgi:cytochrome o ubiquinol oxidase subunit 3
MTTANNITQNNITYSEIRDFTKLAAMKVLGFWIYILSDCILFSALFTTFIVFHTSYAGGPSGHALFKLPNVFIETAILLTSSFTCGIAVLASNRSKKLMTIIALLITLLLGLAFVCIEISEFSDLIKQGNGPDRSAFLSSFFTLVGTHGLHISIGMLWIVVTIGQILWKGLSLISRARLVLFSIFWHFLDLVWIGIFTIVYLWGSMQ